MGFKAWPKNPRDPSPFKINYLQIGGKLSDNIYPIVKHFLIGRVSFRGHQGAHQTV